MQVERVLEVEEGGVEGRRWKAEQQGGVVGFCPNTWVEWSRMSNLPSSQSAMPQDHINQ